MTSKLREALEVNEFKQRYILRRMLCESYIKRMGISCYYNNLNTSDFTDIILSRSYINNMYKRQPDGLGAYDYVWKRKDTFTDLFDTINIDSGTDIEYDYDKVFIKDEELFTSRELTLLKIGFPIHFLLATSIRVGNIIYFTTFDPSGIEYNRRNLDYDSDHRFFQIKLRRWVRERTSFTIMFVRPEVNLCFQYDDYNCQTWIYYYIHFRFIDRVTRDGRWRDFFAKLEEYEDITDKFEVEIQFNILLEEFISFMANKDETIFIDKYPFHNKILF